MLLILKPLLLHVVETVEGVTDVPRYREVDFYFDVVPFLGESTIFFSFPIRCHLIMLLGYSHWVCGMLFADVFDSKIINYKAKLDGALFVGPQTWGKFALKLPLFS